MREPTRFCYPRPSGLRGEAVAYMRGGHPGYPLNKGKPIKDWVLPHFDIGGFDKPSGKRTSSGSLTDFLNNDVGWLIVTARVRGLLTSAGVGAERVQWLDVCIHQNGQEEIGAYFAGNVLDLRSAVHPTKSKFIGPNHSVTKIVLLCSAVLGADIFRLRERPGRAFVSPRQRRLLDDAGVTGVEWAVVNVAD
jgi:hypothetical protein